MYENQNYIHAHVCLKTFYKGYNKCHRHAPSGPGVEINISNLLAHRASVIKILLARPNFHWPAYD